MCGVCVGFFSSWLCLFRNCPFPKESQRKTVHLLQSENHGSGCHMTKPDVILKLERGEEPWTSFAGHTCLEGNWKAEDFLVKFKEYQDKYSTSVLFINHKKLIKKNSNAYEKTFMLSKNSVSSKSLPPEYETHGKIFKSVSELIISNLSPARKRLSEYNGYGKSLLNTKPEPAHPGAKFHIQHGRAVSHNEMLMQYQKMETSAQRSGIISILCVGVIGNQRSDMMEGQDNCVVWVLVQPIGHIGGY
ncbi:hypothetical protein MC885_001352 [Smutsia gigantea]|nr:hypothetical protein MC885_001352 [Smutsia gigantea]